MIAIVAGWRFAQPALAGMPAKVNPGLLTRLLTPRPSMVTAVVMDRANRYFAAGCPVDLCETAAVRDLWLEMTQTHRKP